MDYRKSPIYKHKNKILRALKRHQAVIVESPTGSGKSTCIPLILHEKGVDGIIGITQPRRVATVSLSEFIAKQLGENIPGTVGYKMRFDDHTNSKTKIKILTDGTLLQEMKADHLLSAYKVLIIDEAHERSLTIDFILGILKRIMKVRRDLKVIVSSATINPEKFSLYFNRCPIIRIKAKSYPVRIHYHAPENDYEYTQKAHSTAAETEIVNIIEHRIKKGMEGNILVFLQGEQNIKQAMLHLEKSSCSSRIMLMPLYGRLSKEEQEAAVFLQPRPDTIKVVLATNIAETSLTIDNISAVIDTGMFKINHYNSRQCTFALKELPISRASAEQRKGRAGRQQPGDCYRLYSEQNWQSRELFTPAEITRTDLSEVLLRMAEIDIRDFEDFDFISSPEKKDISAAVSLLIKLQALNRDRSLTNMGKRMLDFPLSPRQSRALLESIIRYPDVLAEVLIVISFLTSQSPYLLPLGEESTARVAQRSFNDNRGDYYTFINLFNSYEKQRDKKRFCSKFYLDSRIMQEIANARAQLEDICIDMGIMIGEGSNNKHLHCALSRGLIDFICIRDGRERYRTLSARDIYIHPGSSLSGKRPFLFVAGEIVSTSKTFARSAGILREEWLPDIDRELGKEMSKLTRILKKQAEATDAHVLRAAGRKTTHTQKTSHNPKRKFRRPKRKRHPHGAS